MTGFTPLQYVHHLRILKAKSLMETKTLSITEIGLNLGYSNSGHFSTKFKEVVGVTRRVSKITSKESRDLNLITL